MKKLTDTQKEILSNLETEFLKLNTPINTKGSGLINVDKIKNLLAEGEKEKQEILLYNEVQNRLLEDYKVETFAKLEEALDELGIECQLRKYDVLINNRERVSFKGITNQYVTLSSGETVGKSTFNRGLSIYFNPHKDTSFESLEELCAAEGFEKIILSICNKKQ